MTTIEFYEHICDLPARFENRSLQSYLSALLLLVQEEKAEELEVEKLLELLGSAFTSEAIAFDGEWLQIRSAPDQQVEVPAGKDFTIAVLKFQIAELHRMRNMAHVDKSATLGLKSPTGNYWYNFDPFTNLECGARSIIDSGGDGTKDEFVCHWEALGTLLEMGRIYE